MTTGNLQSVLQAVKRRKGQSLLLRAGWSLLLRAWKLLRLLPGAQLVRATLPVDGHRLRVRLFSYDDLLTASPRYEAALADWLPVRGDVVVDAGAFIGRHTLDFARAVGPNGQVIAVEPLRANFRLLQRNVALNGYHNVRCVECALGAANGRALLRYSRESSTATCDLARARQAGQKQVARVAQRTLDALLADEETDRVDLIKIDVEGAELAVLAGAVRTLARNPQLRLIVELHGTPQQCEPVTRWLVQRGYAITPVSDEARHFIIAQQPSSSAVEHRVTSAASHR